MIGLKRGTVELSDHDPAWEENAKETTRKLWSLFGDTAVDIQHVGSTAVRTIRAKPIIDIAVAVRALEDVYPLVPELSKHGFILCQHDVPNDILLVCGNFDADTRTHHIHVVPYNSEEWRNYITFRDYLSAHIGEARQYETLKRELMEKYRGDRVRYTEGKAQFIRNVLRRDAAENRLGQTVTVTVDRPLGTFHPRQRNIFYTVNYGYVKGIPGGDGHDQDAYIVGVDRPVSEFTGKIIAVILRENDSEDKWVVAPEDCAYSQAEIKAKVRFMEQFFQSSILCLYEKSCGVIVYRRLEGQIQYLLLFQRRSQTWSFPKGHVEAYETEEGTARRELLEETGLSADIMAGFTGKVSYPIYKNGTKSVHLFLAEASGELSIRPDEIESYRWVCMEEAIDLLPNAGYDKVLEKAEGLLTESRKP